jgi:transcriptional regulator with XRE-family HTH domain
MKKAKQQYDRDSAAFTTTRKRNGLSLRNVSKITGVNFNTIFRFERRKDISAIHYLALCEWTAEENPVF